MRFAVGAVVVVSLSLSSVADAAAEAPIALGADHEPQPEPAWACAASGVKAARIVPIDAPFSLVLARDLDALILEPADVPYVVVEGDTNAVAAIAADVTGGVLEINPDGCADSDSGVRVIVGVPRLEGVEVERVARVRSRRAIALADNALIDIEGAAASDLELGGSDVAVFTSAGGFHKLRVDVAGLIAHQSGPGVLRVTGRATAASLGQDGAGHLIASELEARDVVIDRAGFGEVLVAGQRL